MTTINLSTVEALIPVPLLNELLSMSERAATIVAMAMIDDELRIRIEQTFSRGLDPKKDRFPRMGSEMRAILAHRLGVLERSDLLLLKRLRDVRNLYAHVAFELSKVEQKICEFMDAFFILKQKISFAALEIEGDYKWSDSPVAELLLSHQAPLRKTFRLALLMMVCRVTDSPIFRFPGHPVVRMAMRCDADMMKDQGTSIHFQLRLDTIVPQT